MIEIPGHLHRLRRVLKKGKRTHYFSCMHPHCTFVLSGDLLFGKAAECPYCAKEFVITRRMLNKHGILHCDKCSGRELKPLQSIEDQVQSLINAHVNTPIKNAAAVHKSADDDKRSLSTGSEDIRKPLRKEMAPFSDSD